MTKLFAPLAFLDTGWAENVRVEITNGNIAAVEYNTNAQPGDTLLQDRALLPAMSNLHSHAFQRAMAGMTEYGSQTQDSFWTWRELMYRFLGKLTPAHIEAIAALVYVEMLESGYASVGEFHYVHHQPGGTRYENISETSERIFAAAKQTGIGLTHLPVLYTYGGVQQKELSGGQQRFGHSPEQFCELVEQATTKASQTLYADARVGIAPHSLRATCPDELGQIATEYSDRPIHIHIAEQPKEVEEVSEWLRARPVEWLLDNLDVNENWCLVHATHMTQEETLALAKSKAVAGLCPITEANLGDGIFNGQQFISNDGVLGIGSDSNTRISLSEELRMLEYSQRFRHQARNVLLTGEGSTGETLYKRVLAGGAQALGRNCGAISVGMLADLVSINTDDVCLSGLRTNQLLDGWIFAADDSVVKDVWSAGRHCVKDGRHTAKDTVVAAYKSAIKNLTSAL